MHINEIEYLDINIKYPSPKTVIWAIIPEYYLCKVKLHIVIPFC